MNYSRDRVLAQVQRSPTGLLLDQATVLREAMEPDAVEIIEAELAVRGIGPDEIAAHHRELKHRVLPGARGMPATCSRCGRAAVEARTDWHRLWGLVPIFRRLFYYCDEHWRESGGATLPGGR